MRKLRGLKGPIPAFRRKKIKRLKFIFSQARMAFHPYTLQDDLYTLFSPGTAPLIIWSLLCPGSFY
ncbi:hypothetical protein A5U89_15360 [Salmonella enterica subsp. enterica serovar Virchow]|nr:hypothetical protein [Salmonella enterica subsp. enterica serovar Virchow]